MLTLTFVLFLAQEPDVLRAAAEAHEEAARYLDAAAAYLRLAEQPGVARLDELSHAHDAFFAAYANARPASAADPWHLCRALFLAESTVREDRFRDEQQRLYWKQTAALDLQKLKADAEKYGRPNCRHDAAGRTHGPVLRLARVSVASEPPRPAALRPEAGRRWRAHTAAGASLTGFGLGLMGVLVAALDGQRRSGEAMSAMVREAKTADRDFTPAEQGRFEGLYRDALLFRGAAIGLGVAGATSLVTGVALLATRGKSRRALALHPFGGPLGAGVRLRLEF